MLGGHPRCYLFLRDCVPLYEDAGFRSTSNRPPHRPRAYNATSVAKCKQLMSLRLSLPLGKFGKTNATAKK